MHVSGFADWQAGATWAKILTPNECMLPDLSHKPGAQFNMFLEHALRSQPENRRFGMYLPPRVPSRRTFGKEIRAWAATLAQASLSLNRTRGTACCSLCVQGSFAGAFGL
jgi:hypothetical protein